MQLLCMHLCNACKFVFMHHFYFLSMIARTKVHAITIVSHPRLSYPKREKESGESCAMQLYCAAYLDTLRFDQQSCFVVHSLYTKPH